MGGGNGMEADLTHGAVAAMSRLAEGLRPVLQVAGAPRLAGAAGAPTERYRVLLSDGVHSQEGILATSLNGLVTTGHLRDGSVVRVLDYVCNSVQDRRVIVVIQLEMLQTECTLIGSPTIYEVNAAQPNIGSSSGGLGIHGSCMISRTGQVGNNIPCAPNQGLLGPSIAPRAQYAVDNLPFGGSYGSMLTRNAIDSKMQQLSLNSHQGQMLAVPSTYEGFGRPGNTYCHSAQQPPLVYMSRSHVANNDAPPRVISIASLSPYQGRWTIKGRVTAKTDLRHFGEGKVFSFDLLDAQGGEIRATCFNSAVDQFYDQIVVGNVYFISKGSVKPAQKKFNPLSSEYEIVLDATTSIEICCGDDSSIPKQQFNFRQISEVANMDNEAMVDLLGVVTSVSPSVTITRKNGIETQKRTLQLKDMSGCSVEITFWGNFCSAEGQQLQSLCDSGLSPILALKGGRVCEFNGKSVGTISSTLLKINPEFPDAERLRQWYITEGKDVACTTTGGGFGPPGNMYGRPAQPSYQHPPPVYRNSGLVAKNEAAPRVIPISALNPYQGRWTIKARVTVKSHVKHFNNAKGPGKVFSFDLLDAQGGEIRATCFNAVLDQFYDLIEVDKVYLISRGTLKPAQKKFNPLNNDYEITLETSSSVEICSGDDSSIPRQQFNFRQISEVANMDSDAMVDLLGVVTSVSPSVTVMRKNGIETQKRTLQLKDMSGCSVEIIFWGDFCSDEGQQLQSLCDSGLSPILALKGGRVGEFNGKSVGTISSTLLKINPEFPYAERLRQWYISEGKIDFWKTIAQIKDGNFGRSDQPDFITVKATISHINMDAFCYQACILMFNGRPCNKKVTANGDGTWWCDRCQQCCETCGYSYLLTCQIQDHTGITYATAFQVAGEDIIGLTAQELFTIKNLEQDDAKFEEIMRGTLCHQYLLKLRIKEETFNDETRVKCSIVKAEKLYASDMSRHVLGEIDGLLKKNSYSSPQAQGIVAPKVGFTNLESAQTLQSSNNGYGMTISGLRYELPMLWQMSTPPPATPNVQPECFKCNRGACSTMIQ